MARRAAACEGDELMALQPGAVTVTPVRRGTATVRTTGMRLHGAEELEQRLKHLSDVTRGEIVEAGVRAGAELIAESVRQHVRGTSATLAANIAVEVEQAIDGRAVARVGPTLKTVGRRTLVQALAYWFEFGTRSSTKKSDIRPVRYQKRGRRRRAASDTGPRALTVGGKLYGRVTHRGMRARPFLSPAFLQDSRRAVHRMGQVIYDELRRLGAIR